MDDLGLILFPDMGDFVPNRNFSQKSIQSPAKSPTTQMSKFVDVCNIWSKFKKKYHSFTKLGENLCFLEKMLCPMNSSDSEVFKNVLDVFFITSGTHFI